MAGLNGTIYTAEYRPCIVKGVGKALFHRWVTEMQVHNAVLRGDTGGQLAATFAIVEDASGNVTKQYPEYIRFLDNKIGEYHFPESEDLQNEDN